MSGSTAEARIPDSFRFGAGMALAAAIIAALLRVVAFYDHGIWLVAYLFLVGFLALYLIGLGQERLVPGVSAGTIHTQVSLWLLGVVTVPAGVLVDARILVTVGSLVLMAALTIFYRQLTPFGADARPRGQMLAYLALLAFMAISVVTGFLLSSGTPWF